MGIFSKVKDNNETISLQERDFRHIGFSQFHWSVLNQTVESLFSNFLSPKKAQQIKENQDKKN